MPAPLYSLKLASGESLTFQGGYNLSTHWADLPGIYIFVKPAGNRWEVLYVGQTDSFRGRGFTGHEKWPAAVRLGATEIHAVQIGLATDRTRLEDAIYREYDPPCNDVRPPVRGLGMLMHGLPRVGAVALAAGLGAHYTRYAPVPNALAAAARAGLGLRR